MASPTTALSPEQARIELQSLLAGPAATPPAGVIPNFHNPPNLNTFVTLTLTLCVTFGALAVLVRMYTKLFLIRAVAYEDCTSLSSAMYEFEHTDSIQTLLF